MSSLKGTKTAENLLKAFAGESQARNRYNYYSSTAKKEGFEQISKIFNETAENEKEHAKLFFKFLSAEYAGEAISIQADYPVGFGTTADNLKYAAEGEHEEWSEAYPAFAAVAKEEGFDAISQCFTLVATIEKHHEERYRKLLENINNGNVFKKEIEVDWVCNNCGFIHHGTDAPGLCPACKHPQGYFQVNGENY